MPSDHILSAKVELHQPSKSSFAIDARGGWSGGAMVLGKLPGVVGWCEGAG